MQRQLISTMVALCIFLPVRASDYFPAKVGNTWEFDYVNFEGHSRGGLTDSGIVTWKISAIEQQGNAKKITIQQQRTLYRSTRLLAADPNNYDSIFNPPHVLPAENVDFIDSGNVLYRTYLRYNRQTTQVLVHDAKVDHPSTICVHDTVSKVLNSQRPSKLVITGSCNLTTDGSNSHPVFDYFLQCDSIGPVIYIYDSHGTTFMVGGHSTERWTLHSLPVSIKSKLTQVPDIRISTNRPRLSLRINEFPYSMHESNLIYDLRGRIVPNISSNENQLKSNGVFIRFQENGKR